MPKCLLCLVIVCQCYILSLFYAIMRKETKATIFT